MKTLYVRVAVKSVDRFSRAGHTFTRAWRRLTDVDEATARRLAEEQMLEVSEKEPEGFESTAEGDSPLQQAAPGETSPLALLVSAGADGLLPTHVLDAITSNFQAHLELDRRADRDQIAALNEECGNQRVDLIAARESLARVSKELSDTRARLAAALDDHQHLVQAYEALKRSVETPAAVAAAVSERVDSAIAQGAIDALAEGTAEIATETKPKKGGK